MPFPAARLGRVSVRLAIATFLSLTVMAAAGAVAAQPTRDES
jgi:hypothetical protein